MRMALAGEQGLCYNRVQCVRRGADRGKPVGSPSFQHLPFLDDYIRRLKCHIRIIMYRLAILNLYEIRVFHDEVRREKSIPESSGTPNSTVATGRKSKQHGCDTQRLRRDPT